MAHKKLRLLYIARMLREQTDEDHMLLHICCAPCSVFCVDSLRAEGIEPAGFWFNPNIHPYQASVYSNRALSRWICLA